MVPYPLNGRPTAFWRGDWFVGKGVACARLRFGPEPEDVIEVFNTHTHPAYSSSSSGKGGGGDDSYRVHRRAQAWVLAKLLRGAAERGHLVVAAGDFNMTPLGPEHRIITGHAPVRDVWRLLHPDSSLGSADEPRERARGRPVPSAEFNLLENGATSNNVLNTWRWPRADQRCLGPGRPLLEIEPTRPDPRGQRLDYLFVSTAARDLGEAAIGGWVVQSARVGMLARHPDLGCSLSDHFSVEATLVFHATSLEGAGISTAAPSLGAGTGTGTSLLASHFAWPLPPGRLSNISAFRRSLHVPLQADQATTNTNPDADTPAPAAAAAAAEPGAEPNANANADPDHSHDQDHDEDYPDDLRSPAAGAFLSLGSPTPSTSRPSLRQTDPHRPDLDDSDPDLDAQLLSSLLLPDDSHPATSGSNTGAARIVSRTRSRETPHFAVRDYDALLADLKLYAAREADQARLRALHFFFWIFVLVACCIAVWFIPAHSARLSEVQNHAVNFILLLLSSLGLVAGTVDGLMALLFFRGSENRALREFEWEVRNARALAIGDTGAGYEDIRLGKF